MRLAAVLWILALTGLAAAAAAAPQSPQTTSPPTATHASLEVTGAAQALFERDWVLMNWALKYYDRNGDLLIDAQEARDAAAAFRRIADIDRDGRVTPEEYRAARAQILAQY